MKIKYWLLLAFIACYAGILLFFSFLDFSPLQSDALGYWKDSLQLANPYHPFHVPGYPFVIAALRLATLSLLKPVVYLQIISFTSFLGALFLVFEIGMHISKNEKAGMLFAVLFMLWPMVGLTYVAYPVADSLAMFLYLLGMFLVINGKPMPASFAWAGALFVHKAMWVFVGISFLAWAFQLYQTQRGQIFLSGIIIFSPLIVFTLLGAFFHNSLSWIISSNLQVEVSSRSNLPIFDGLIGNVQNTNFSSVLKTMIIWLQFVFAIFITIYTHKNKYLFWEFGLAVGLSTILLMIFLNQYEIWASIRFGRLLVLPLSGIFGKVPLSKKLMLARFEKPIMISLGLILYTTQLGYAWYMTRYFGG